MLVKKEHHITISEHERICLINYFYNICPPPGKLDMMQWETLNDFFGMLKELNRGLYS